MLKLKFILPLSIILTAGIANADDLKSLTIYGNSEQIINAPIIYTYETAQNIPGYAYATFTKDAEFKKGRNTITIENLPERIDQSSITLLKSGKGKTLLEQYVSTKSLSDLISTKADTIVTVEQIVGDKVIEHKGKILPIEQTNGYNEIALLQDDGKIILINNPNTVSYQKPEGFDLNSSLLSNATAKSALNWLIESSDEGADKLEYSYKTSGISWASEYRFDIPNSSKDSAQLEGWANIINFSGVDYSAKNLKLIAGSVNSAPLPYAPVPRMAMAKAQNMAFDAAGSGAPESFNSESFSDLQSYTIDRTVDLPKQTSKKIKLFDNKPNVKFERQYVVDSNYNSGNSVSVNFNLLNKVENGLGSPLPAGRFKVFEQDAGGISQFIGEATIKNSTVEDEINVTTGQAFDIKSERKVINQNNDNTRKVGSFDVEYELSNQKATDVKVIIREYIYQNNWNITNNAAEFKKTDANRTELVVPIKANSKEVLKFTVNYTW